VLEFSQNELRDDVTMLVLLVADRPGRPSVGARPAGQGGPGGSRRPGDRRPAGR
jgi:hypothetical protein